MPSISYGSSIWFLQSAVDTKKLKSLQYQFGKLLFRVNRNVACHAVLGDLGWSDIQSILNNSRIKYLDRLQKMNGD